MNNQEIVLRLQEVFRDVFDNEELVITENTSSKDIEEWDSLNNIQLVVSVEHEFNVKFTSVEIPSWKNVGDMAKCITSKIEL